MPKEIKFLIIQDLTSIPAGRETPYAEMTLFRCPNSFPCKSIKLRPMYNSSLDISTLETSLQREKYGRVAMLSIILFMAFRNASAFHPYPTAAIASNDSCNSKEDCSEFLRILSF